MIHCETKLLVKLARYLSGSQIEQVAALIGRKEGEDYFVLDILPAQNEDEDPVEKFYISKTQLEKLSGDAHRQGCTLLGIAHSHLPHHPAYPSMADVRYCRHGINAVYHPMTQTLTWFNNKGALSRQLVDQRPRVRIFQGMQRIFASV
jgi:proteasome lid subunit RPN8/RPN11